MNFLSREAKSLALLIVVEPLVALQVNLGEVLVRQIVLLDSPGCQLFVEVVESNGLGSVHFRPELFHVESLNQLAVHEKEQVESLNIWRDVLLTEVRIELLEREVLENLLTLSVEETANFLSLCELLEEVSVLKLSAMLRVVAHEILGEENARVETSTDAWINFVCAFFVGEAVALTR